MIAHRPLVLALSLALVGFLVPDPVAAASVSCLVKEAKSSEVGRGANARPRFELKLRCGNRTRSFRSDATNARDMLAIALTAKVLGRKVRANFRGRRLTALSLL